MMSAPQLISRYSWKKESAPHSQQCVQERGTLTAESAPASRPETAPECIDHVGETQDNRGVGLPGILGQRCPLHLERIPFLILRRFSAHLASLTCNDLSCSCRAHPSSPHIFRPAGKFALHRQCSPRLPSRPGAGAGPAYRSSPWSDSLAELPCRCQHPSPRVRGPADGPLAQQEPSASGSRFGCFL